VDSFEDQEIVYCITLRARFHTGSRGPFWGGNTLPCPDLPAVDIANVIRKGAATTRHRVSGYNYCSTNLLEVYMLVLTE